MLLVSRAIVAILPFIAKEHLPHKVIVPAPVMFHPIRYPFRLVGVRKPRPPVRNS